MLHIYFSYEVHFANIQLKILDKNTEEPHIDRKKTFKLLQDFHNFTGVILSDFGETIVEIG